MDPFSVAHANRRLEADVCLLVMAAQGADESSLDYALNRALDAYYDDRTWFNSLAARIMRQDWSWNRPALDYVELYWQAMK